MAQRYLSLLLLLVVLFSTATHPQSALPAQDSSPHPQATDSKSSPPREPQVVYEPATVLRAITRLVVVDVVATEGSGAPVTDLRLEDFTIVEEGKEQKIRVFGFQHPSPAPSAGVPAAHTQAVSLPPNVFSNFPKYKPDTALNVLLLDALNTNLPNQAYARQQMIKYLSKIPDGQPIAVYALGRNLHLVQDFTTDSSVLRKIVQNLKMEASPLQDNPTGGPPLEIAPAGAFDSGLIPPEMQDAMIEFENERVSFQTDLRVRYTVDALNSLARSLSGYAGRKNLLWISEAFPISIDPDFTLGINGFSSTRNYAPDVAEAAENLTDAQIAVYPIDARGLATSSVFSAATPGADKFGRSYSRPGRMQQAISSESAELQNVHASMHDLAERTGGKAFYNRNDLDTAIRKSIDDGSTYYTLGYYPENKNWNGKFRKIHVKVARQGVKLRYRLGYYALDPKIASEAAQKHQVSIFGQSLSLDDPVSTGLRFYAGIVQPSEKTQNKVLVNFGLDPHAVSFDQQNDGLQRALVDCAVKAYSEQGKLLKTEISTLKVSLQPDTFRKVMQTILPCQKSIDLPPGIYLLRLGVMDERTTLIGTTTAKVTVNPPERTAENKPDGTKP